MVLSNQTEWWRRRELKPVATSQPFSMSARMRRNPHEYSSESRSLFFLLGAKVAGNGTTLKLSCSVLYRTGGGGEADGADPLTAIGSGRKQFIIKGSFRKGPKRSPLRYPVVLAAHVPAVSTKRPDAEQRTVGG